MITERPFPDIHAHDVTTGTLHGDLAFVALLHTLRRQANSDLNPIAYLIMQQLYPNMDSNAFDHYEHVCMLANNHSGNHTPRAKRMLEMFGVFYVTAMWWMHDEDQPRDALTNQFVLDIQGREGKPIVLPDNFDRDAAATPSLIAKAISGDWTVDERKTFEAIFTLSGALTAACEFFARALIESDGDPDVDDLEEDELANALVQAFVNAPDMTRVVADIRRFGGEDTLTLMIHVCRAIVSIDNQIDLTTYGADHAPSGGIFGSWEAFLPVFDLACNVGEETLNDLEDTPECSAQIQLRSARTSRYYPPEVAERLSKLKNTTLDDMVLVLHECFKGNGIEGDNVQRVVATAVQHMKDEASEFKPYTFMSEESYGALIAGAGTFKTCWELWEEGTLTHHHLYHDKPDWVRAIQDDRLWEYKANHSLVYGAVIHVADTARRDILRERYGSKCLRLPTHLLHDFSTVCMNDTSTNGFVHPCTEATLRKLIAMQNVADMLSIDYGGAVARSISEWVDIMLGTYAIPQFIECQVHATLNVQDCELIED
jgi:hypothetical protein